MRGWSNGAVGCGEMVGFFLVWSCAFWQFLGVIIDAWEC